MGEAGGAGGGGGSSKMSTAAYRGRGCHALCVHSHSHYLFSYFSLSHSFLFHLQKLNVNFIQKRCVCHKRLFFSDEINFCLHEISFFHLELFLLSKLVKML